MWLAELVINAFSPQSKLGVLLTLSKQGKNNSRAHSASPAIFTYFVVNYHHPNLGSEATEAPSVALLTLIGK